MSGVSEVSSTYPSEIISKSIPVGYKQTEVGVIPEDWEVHSLSSICDVRDGTHDSPKYKDNGIPLVTSKNIVDDILDLSNVSLISPEDAFEIDKRSKVDKGDIIMSMIGTVGSAVLLLDEPKFCIKNVALFKPKKVSGEFLVQLIRSKIFQDYLEDSRDGGIQKFVSLGTLRNMEISLPSEREQAAIANALSDVDALISELEKLIAKKQAIKTATMQQLLTGRTRLPQFVLREDGTKKGTKKSELGEIPEDWRVVILGDISNLNMGQSPSSGNYNAKGIGLPLIQGNADISNRKTIIRNYTSQITKKANKGDLLISVRAPVGEVAIAEFDCCIGRGVCAIRYPNSYLYHWLINFESQWEKFSKGSTFDSINSDELRTIQLVLPSNEEQTAIATILSDMDTEIQALEQRLSKTRQIKQGMMQELLTGKTRLPYDKE